jgi:hypothetical protein
MITIMSRGLIDRLKALCSSERSLSEGSFLFARNQILCET